VCLLLQRPFELDKMQVRQGHTTLLHLWSGVKCSRKLSFEKTKGIRNWVRGPTHLLTPCSICSGLKVERGLGSHRLGVAVLRSCASHKLHRCGHPQLRVKSGGMLVVPLVSRDEIFIGVHNYTSNFVPSCRFYVAVLCSIP